MSQRKNSEDDFTKSTHSVGPSSLRVCTAAFELCDEVMPMIYNSDFSLRELKVRASRWNDVSLLERSDSAMNVALDDI